MPPRIVTAVLLVLTSYGQVLPVGTADGTITDPSGAVLAAAKINPLSPHQRRRILLFSASSARPI
jgi:hypothetical protein